jgi:asparagine synthase (glutamine-hydrolysing)
MARALEDDARYTVALHHEAGVGLGRVGHAFGRSPHVAWNHDRTACAVVDGELYDRAPLDAELGLAGRASLPPTDADVVLALYERDGTRFAARLNGGFVAAIWDRRARRLLVANDRLGTYPLYYARPDGALLFASGVRALLASPSVSRAIDPVAVQEFFTFDHVLGDRTLVGAVKLLPQASVLSVCDGQVAIEPYWPLRYPALHEARPEAWYLEQFVHLLKQAVARQQPDGLPAGILLSGGMDSRLLLGPLRELGATVEALTFGIPGCDDARIAKELAEAVGSRHRFFELEPDWLQRKADDAVRATDGLGNIVNLHAFATLDAQVEFAKVFYKGFLGDALFGWAIKRQMWGDYDPATHVTMQMDTYIGHGAMPYDPRKGLPVLSAALNQRAGDGLLEDYREGYRRAGSSQLAVQRLYFDLTQRVPRMTLNGVEVVRSRGIVRLPFCDNDLVDFALAMPPGMLFERRIQKDALTRYYPRLAQLPLPETGRPLSFCARDVAWQVRTLAGWHLRKRGLGWLAPREGERPYKDYNRWFRTALRPWVEDLLLTPRTLDRGLVDPAFVRRLVDEHMAGANHAVKLGALLTFELWHRRFAD